MLYNKIYLANYFVSGLASCKCPGRNLVEDTGDRLQRVFPYTDIHDFMRANNGTITTIAKYITAFKIYMDITTRLMIA